MFKSILVPIDLADTELAKPAIATAATLSKTYNAKVRLLNVLPMTPVMGTREFWLSVVRPWQKRRRSNGHNGTTPVAQSVNPGSPRS